MSEPKTFDVLLVAAEASSELYGRRIIEEAQRRNLKVRFFGIGSEAMSHMGFDLVERSENMAVVGLFEVLAHWNVISGAFRRLLARAKAEKPKLALLLDYPDFNLRLAKKLNGLKIPVFYFISPQVWAWRTGRVHLIKKIISKMLVVFPFEKGFYEKFDVPVSFVGHPLLDEIKKFRLDEKGKKDLREKYGFKADEFVVALLPGSRTSELKYNFQTQIQAAVQLSTTHKNARFVILVAPTLDVARVQSLIPDGLNISFRLIKDEPLKILQMCDAGIVTSGTATLMAGLAELPMVIMYKMNAATGFLAKKLVRGEFFGMANLILGERTVPELFQTEANPENLAAAIALFADDVHYRQKTKIKLSEIKDRLGSGGAIGRVVDELEGILR